MPTGVRTADIIAGVYGARHRGKMQEAEARQYMTQQEERRAQAKAEGEERLFSRKAQIFSLTGDPAAAEQIATTGDFSGMKLKPSPAEIKAQRDEELARSGIELAQSPEVQELIARGDMVGLNNVYLKAGIGTYKDVSTAIHRTTMASIQDRTRKVIEKGFTNADDFQEAQELIGFYNQERGEFDLRKGRLEGWKKYKADLNKWADNQGIDAEDIERELARKPQLRNTMPSPGTYGLPEDYDPEFEQEDLAFTTDKSRRERIDRLESYAEAVKKKQPSVDVLMRYGQTLMPQSEQAGTAWNLLNSLDQKE